MLFDKDGQFYSGTTAWTITGDEWSPNIIDMTVSYPTLQNSDELAWWIQVYSAADVADTFQFQLACSATNDATNLDGTILYPLSTQAWASNGAFMQGTDGAGKFWHGIVPPDTKLRYWQAYCIETGSAGPNVVVYTGLCLRSALVTRAGNISNASSVTLP